MGKFLYILSFIFLILGGLNWLFVVWGFNIVEKIFTNDVAVDTIYWVIGIATIYQLILKICCKRKCCFKENSK
jgi:uncharacterized membrane protein YuzA (DUF378 family)